MADAVRQAAIARATRFIPVEPGVTGKEKTFQQNRNFGPGPIKPYVGGSAESKQHYGPYTGGAKARLIPSGGKPGAKTGTPDRQYGTTYRRQGEQTV